MFIRKESIKTKLVLILFVILRKVKLFNVSIIVVPTLSSLSTDIEASICCASSLAMYNPSPEPPVFVFLESSTLNVLQRCEIEVHA